MSRLGLVDRVKSWFGTKSERAESPLEAPAKRWSLGPPESARLALATAGAGSAAAPAARPAAPAPGDSADAAALMALDGQAVDMAAGASPARLDPLDPVWIQSLDDLPERIAESVAAGAIDNESLREIGYELEGHRQSTRAMLEAVRRLPDLATCQTEIGRETNKILERQSLILESMFDGVTGLRSAFRTVEESSRRHILAISQLESSHRQVLLEYQRMFAAAQRRLTWLAVGAVALAAGALGGLAYVAWRVLVP